MESLMPSEWLAFVLFLMAFLAFQKILWAVLKRDEELEVVEVALELKPMSFHLVENEFEHVEYEEDEDGDHDDYDYSEDMENEEDYEQIVLPGYVEEEDFNEEEDAGDAIISISETRILSEETMYKMCYFFRDLRVMTTLSAVTEGPVEFQCAYSDEELEPIADEPRGGEPGSGGPEEWP